MARFAKDNRVIFWEEPEYFADAQGTARLDIRPCAKTGVIVARPELPAGMSPQDEEHSLRGLLDTLMTTETGPLVRWYYTPMMFPFSRHIAAQCTIYDCMDALANFKNAPPELLSREADLLEAADLVFTGGYSLYEAMQDRHDDIHPFPSSVDVAHFNTARTQEQEPEDQAHLPRPRLGFYGVIDERMDLDLVSHLAQARPDWSIVLIGPVVKIDPATLPRHPNIHWLGSKDYSELPAYLGGWDVALMPFAINEATRFISPTKTPEYLAGGCPVVSTPIADVVRHYGDLAAVRIADTPDAFVEACDALLALRRESHAWRDQADALLADMSWDKTFSHMAELVAARMKRPQGWNRPANARRDGPHYDYLVVGAGFAGSVMAERLAADAGKKVLVIDRRPHIAGNAFDRLDDAGILIHQYGPHIFHTNSEDIFAYLSRFTSWRSYEHRVLASVDGMLVPMPINRTTINALYALDLTTEDEVDAFLASRAEPVEVVRTSADVVISKIGRDLYEKFFQGYTRKQWGMDPSELDKSVTARVPTRSNTDDRYFTDKFQVMPRNGFTAMFENMLSHPNIDIELGVDYRDVRERVSFDRLVFTGPVDEYFDYCYGRLPYRSLQFKHETVDTAQFQPVAVINYPEPSVPYTRVTEYKHLTGQRAERTSITYEFPSEEGDPYYPIPRAANQLLYKRYEALADAAEDVLFVGRLATYRYYNMDQVVGQALATYRKLGIGPVVEAAPEPLVQTA
ncbi:UDP-galactopyranose mutase [Sphingobium subterraneum]|uniref:UDP-galactopyranose mutase n=1 Tax=Sphingobium subterraneum TaxID=627688 RepID=A0A841J1H0_9SPHN|nr:UDP-galactopyranose mutase [Sphingobium subterraneum]MBB6124192.1 UDP-galactopyranose mutase [Sphingobium subterraneum]